MSTTTRSSARHARPVLSLAAAQAEIAAYEALMGHMGDVLTLSAAPGLNSRQRIAATITPTAVTRAAVTRSTPTTRSAARALPAAPAPAVPQTEQLTLSEYRSRVARHLRRRIGKAPLGAYWNAAAVKAGYADGTPVTRMAYLLA